ncbi:hypothetical protein D3C74_143870 [compost metagenome]
MGDNLFKGFSQDGLDFLENVRLNNSKEWYEEHRNDYQELLLKPFQYLVSDLSADILQIDSLFVVTPSVNKTISRLFRDTRFSKDKSLYRSTMWLTFKRPKVEWRDAPAFFFEISPEGYRYGMGYYSATRESMDVFREMMVEDIPKFMEAISFYDNQDIYVIEGDMYKKPLNPSISQELRQWHDRKNIYLVHNESNVDKLFSQDIADEVLRGFKLLEPIYHYLCRAEERKRTAASPFKL